MPKLSHDELVARLRVHTHQPIPDAVREQHLAAIDAAASWADAHDPAPTGRHGWRRPVTVLVTAATFVSASGVAVASQGAQPGQPLYGVKILSERLTGVLVDDLVARRRVEELARLVTEDAEEITLQQAVARATDAVAGLPADHPLNSELAVLLALLQPPPAPSTGGGDTAGQDEPVIWDDAAEPRPERRADGDDDTDDDTGDDTDDDDTHDDTDTDDDSGAQTGAVTEPDDDDTDDVRDSVSGAADGDDGQDPADDDPTDDDPTDDAPADEDAAEPDDDTEEG